MLHTWRTPSYPLPPRDHCWGGQNVWICSRKEIRGFWFRRALLSASYSVNPIICLAWYGLLGTRKRLLSIIGVVLCTKKKKKSVCYWLGTS